MPLNVAERRIVEARGKAIGAAILEFAASPWPARARAANVQLEGIHADWWGRHVDAPGAYAADLAALNALARWKGEFAAVTAVTRNGRRYLAPPKFFGGDVAALSEDFVLAISLNHATPETDAYLLELADLQRQETCLAAHRGYFRQPYVHGRFFKPRATVLRAYAARRELDAPESWALVNERLSLYLERYPTLSARCVGSRVPPEELADHSFVMALNALAHDVVLRLLRPRAVLLAGKATWSLLPAAGPEDVGTLVRPGQRPTCPVTRDRVELVPGARTTTVVRANFLRSVHGPNSNAELAAIGELLAT